MKRICSSPKCKIKIIKAGIIPKVIKITRTLKERINLKMTIKKVQNKKEIRLAKILNKTVNPLKRQQHLRISMRISNPLTSRTIFKL